MFHVNVPKLKGKMAEKGYTITSLAKALGISRSALSSYMKDPGKMTFDLVSRMAALLCDSCGEARWIFTERDIPET